MRQLWGGKEEDYFYYETKNIRSNVLTIIEKRKTINWPKIDGHNQIK